MARDRNTLTIRRGDSYPIPFTLVDAAGAALDLTDCAVVLTVNSLEAPPDDTTELCQVAGVLADDPTTGGVSFTPTTADTAVPGEYHYDIQVTEAAGHVRTPITSTLTILQDITK
jgi:hypothetical protein